MKNPVIFFNEKTGNVPYFEHSLLDDPFWPQEPFYKVYHDGSNYVAIKRRERKSFSRGGLPKTDLDVAFGLFYAKAMQKGLSNAQTIRFVFDSLEANFNPEIELLEYVQRKVQDALPTLSLFVCFNLVIDVCLSVGAKRRHLYQDKHTPNCHFNNF